ARALGQPAVPGVALVQDAQGERDGQRLAARAAGVRLQRVAEPAVGVAVGGDRVPDRARATAGEQPLEPAAADHPRARGQELRRGIDIWFRHVSTAARRQPRRLVRNGRAGARLVPVEWTPGYREWAPPPELGGSVACLWTRVVPPGGGPAALVLPDACS